MKIAVIGSNGQLGTDLMQVLAAEDVIGLTHADIEITDEKNVFAVLEKTRPAAVINTAAFHNTGRCEDEPEQAFKINAVGPLFLAKACAKIDSLLIHISTDYVFDGSKGKPYLEHDPVAPLSVYGISKVAGEHNVLSYCEKHYVVRSSGLYGAVPCRAKGDNFITKILRIAREKGKASVVTDEVLTPTWTYSLAEQLYRLCQVDSVPYGVIHATNEGQCSWYEFTKVIFELTKTPAALLEARVSDFPMTVKRPTYSVLENFVLNSCQDNTMSHWRDALQNYLKL